MYMAILLILCYNSIIEEGGMTKYDLETSFDRTQLKKGEDKMKNQ